MCVCVGEGGGGGGEGGGFQELLITSLLLYYTYLVATCDRTHVSIPHYSFTLYQHTAYLVANVNCANIWSATDSW